jgi:hypothetical protein
MSTNTMGLLRPGLRGAALLLVLVLTACQRQDEGAAVTQTRGVDAFHSIEVRGAARLDVLVGPQQSLVVEGSSTGLERLRTEVRNGRLVIESRGGWLWSQASTRLRVRITVPQLRALELNGAGDISLSGLDGGALAIVLSGAGRMEGNGRVDTLTARVNGAGSIDLARLKSTDAEVAVNGTGSIEVDVSGELDATVNGVGNISYVGKPTRLNSSINGVGSIGPR